MNATAIQERVREGNEESSRHADPSRAAETKPFSMLQARGLLKLMGMLGCGWHMAIWRTRLLATARLEASHLIKARGILHVAGWAEAEDC